MINKVRPNCLNAINANILRVKLRYVRINGGGGGSYGWRW